VGQAAHIVDTIQWYMNSKEPVAVTCTGGKVNLTGAEVPETANLVIEYPENYLATFTREDFAGAEERQCSHTWMGSKWLSGGDYLAHFALPNFYFHLVTAYDILRHNGVDVGKMDYIVSLPLRDS